MSEWTPPRDAAVQVMADVLFGGDYRRALTAALELSLNGVSLRLDSPNVIDASARFARAAGRLSSPHEVHP